MRDTRITKKFWKNGERGIRVKVLKKRVVPFVPAFFFWDVEDPEKFRGVRNSLTFSLSCYHQYHVDLLKN